jgi:hypothetical protein
VVTLAFRLIPGALAPDHDGRLARAAATGPPDPSSPTRP